MEGLRSNDETVLGELYVRHKRLIFSYIGNHGGSEQDSEDMLQEAIVVLWQNARKPDFRLTSGPGTYLLAVAKNKWMAILRKRSKLVANEVTDIVPEDGPSSDDLLVKKEQTEIIGRALDLISPNCRKLLLMFYFEELSLSEIAGRLHLANANVAKAKKYQCKKSLEAILAKEMFERERRVE